jgi:hypothetical protein
MRAAADRLGDGALTVAGLLPGASNGTLLGSIEGVAVVYKPIAGEAPLWDFPDGTLAAREVAAYRLADALGWPAVPPTVLRDGPMGPGAVQLFVEHDPREHFFTLRDRRLAELRSVAAFDVVANNADRKGGHVLVDAGGTLWAIDHGLCFHAEPKLRTVIWEFAGEPVPEDLCEDLRRVAGELPGVLDDLLDPAELEAAADRAQRLAETGRFPEPGPDRAVPWPPV